MKNYTLFPKYIFRTPLLPLSTFLDAFKSSTPEDTLVELKKYLDDPTIIQAIYIASPSLYAAYHNWLKGEISDPEKIKKLTFSLLKYVSRMSSRCTPFGLFASVNIGEWANKSHIILNEKEQNYQRTRLDMQYLCELKNELEADKDIRQLISFHLNSSIYIVGDEIRYVEFNPSAKSQNYTISAIENSEYLDTIFNALAKQGRMKLSSIAELLVCEDISFEDAYEYVELLVDNQLLISELEPNILGDEYWENMLKTLNKYQSGLHPSHHIYKKIQALNKADDFIKNLNASKNKVARYIEIQKELSIFKTPIDTKHFLQVDLKGSCETPQLEFKIAGAVRKALEVLFRLGRYHSEQNLIDFRTNFYNKYESKQVPLLEALDNEIGVGYSTNKVGAGNKAPLIDKIPVSPPNNKNHKEIKWTKTEDYYLKKYLYAIKNNEKEVIIQDSELPENKEKEWSKTTDSLDMMIQVINDPSKEEPLILLKGGGFGSAANMLGRFTHLDEGINTFTKSIAQHESDCNPNAVLASVSHLPKPRFGNFMLRKKIYDYEIPFLTNTNSSDESQIKLQDLYISVENNRVILWSKKLNKEVIPRLSTAHNFHHSSLPVYHFLCDLQYQNKIGILNFNWGVLRTQFKYLPRVKYKNVILHRATWQFKKDDVKELFSIKKQDLKASVKAWQKKWSIPDLVYLIEADNELLFNLNSDIFIQLFVEEIKKRPQFSLSECLFNADNTLIKDIDKKTYTNECLISFGKKTPNQNTILSPSMNSPKQEVQRIFSPGSEWLYYKIYMGEQAANEILLTKIQPLLQQFQQQNYIDKWFFIRYADPNTHIRLRMHLTQNKAFQNIIPTVHHTLDRLLNTGTIWDIQLDTYKREIERYGENTIHLFEDIFYHDSLLTCKILAHTFDTPNDQNLLLLAALKSIDAYLSNLSYSLEEKRDRIKNIKTGFDKEFGAGKHTSKSINESYKSLLAFIKNIETDPQLQSEWLPIEKAIESRSLAVSNTLKTIKNLHIEGQHSAFQESIWALIHVSINRLAHTKARKHELLFHNLLFRYYNMLISTGVPVDNSCFDVLKKGKYLVV